MRPQHFPSGAHTIGESIERFLSPRRAAIDTSVAGKHRLPSRSLLVVPPRTRQNLGVESPSRKGDSACKQSRSSSWGTRSLGSAHLDAATAHLLDLIREFDARDGWNNGFRSCAARLTWRVGLDPGAARERVRVARALGTLPRLAAALARGELSYFKVRALSRVATPETEERLLAVGRAGTAEHVESIVRGWRRVDRKAEMAEDRKRHVSRWLQVYQSDDGMVTIRGQLAPEAGVLLLKALTAARETLYKQTRRTFDDPPVDVSAETPAMDQQQADALALLAESALHH